MRSKSTAVYVTLIAARNVTATEIASLHILPAGRRDILAQHLLTKLFPKLRHSLQNLNNGPPYPGRQAVRHMEPKKKKKKILRH